MIYEWQWNIDVQKAIQEIYLDIFSFFKESLSVGNIFTTYHKPNPGLVFLNTNKSKHQTTGCPDVPGILTGFCIATHLTQNNSICLISSRFWYFFLINRSMFGLNQSQELPLRSGLGLPLILWQTGYFGVQRTTQACPPEAHALLPTDTPDTFHSAHYLTACFANQGVMVTEWTEVHMKKSTIYLIGTQILEFFNFLKYLYKLSSIFLGAQCYFLPNPSSNLHSLPFLPLLY